MTTNRYLVTGAGGQLGRAIVDAAGARDLTVIATTHTDLPIEDETAVRAAFDQHQPTVVLHCAAWTDVDGCELDPARADLINGTATAHIAQACQKIGARLIYVSTDFVFDGSKRDPYTPDDPTAPISAYGRSKLLGEQGALEAGGFVVRTSWVYGPGGKNFPRAILARAREGGPLTVVDDQVGSPTMTRDLAEALLDLAGAEAPPGVYHACNEGSCSWHRFACEIVQRAGLSGVEVATMSSRELDRPAPRPAYSVLDCSGLTSVRGRQLPNYLDGLERYLSEELA